MEVFLIHLINGVVMGSTYVLMALGVTLIFGIVDVVQVAHGEVYMIGAFLTLFFVNAMNLNYFVAMVLSMAVVAVFGILLERAVFKRLRGRPHLPVILGAFGLSLVLQNLALMLLGGESHAIRTVFTSQVIRLGAVTITAQRLIVVVGALVLTIALHLFTNHTRFGMAMRAIAQDKKATDLVGINADSIYALAFAVASALAAAAGALVGPILLVQPAMGFLPFLKAFIVVLFGGVGSVIGSIIGGLLLGVGETFGAAYISTQYKDGVAYALLIAILLFKPNGLFGRSSG